MREALFLKDKETNMLTVDPAKESPEVLHQYLIGSVAPRPIAFASTIDNEGNPNLSPFSFFNCFGSNPPILVFSPSRRVRDNTIKHTLENIQEVKEVVINVVSYDMVQQTSLASAEFPKGVNEFEKSGFTPIHSERVKPFRVKESPVQMECIVKDIIALGDKGGAGNLVICEVVLMHINESVIGNNGKPDPYKMDLVARMGQDFYCRALDAAIFKVIKPPMEMPVGFEGLPEKIKISNVLSGNDLALLASVKELPKPEEIEAYKYHSHEIQEIYALYSTTEAMLKEKLELFAKLLLQAGNIQEAWKVLLLE